MKNLDEEARRWLETYADEFDLEELPSESKKAESSSAVMWPNPEIVPGLGKLREVSSEDGFNRIVGNPSNWSRILGDKAALDRWVSPNAVVIFGKSWFDCMKWKSTIQRSAELPLFSAEEKEAARSSGVPLENTPSGKSKIARIISRVDHAVRMYLNGGGLSSSGRIKRPGGYIINSIKNEFISDIGADEGYKLIHEPVCPYCLGAYAGRGMRCKVVMKSLGDGFYECERCSDVARSIEMSGEPDQAELRRRRCFSRVSHTTIVCPSDRCRGRFVPVGFVSDREWLLTKKGRAALFAASRIRPPRSVRSFQDPPDEMLDMPLECPHCGENFTPRSALARKSGFKGRGGMVTGLPTMAVWWRPEVMSGSAIANFVQDGDDDPSLSIEHEQHVGILKGELLVRIADLACRNTEHSLILRYFYEAAAEWMENNKGDASRYFFGWRAVERATTKKEQAAGRSGSVLFTEVERGQESAVHQSIFYAWMRKMSENIGKIRATGGTVRRLDDLAWLCRKPKHSSGPRSLFTSAVESDMSVPNRSAISGSPKPRIAWVLSATHADSGMDVLPLISSCEWQAVRISKHPNICVGDMIRIKALMMPGHHSHAPIRRIMRLRTDILAGVIGAVRKEEQSGETNARFWSAWRKRVGEAKAMLESREVS